VPIDEQPGERHVVERHGLLGNRQVDAMGGDQGVQCVEVGRSPTVHLGDGAVLEHQGRLRVVGTRDRHQTELHVLVREAVEVDPLLVHEADATHRLLLGLVRLTRHGRNLVG
jgi:hypothetical protein